MSRRRPPDLSSIQRILIVRFSAIGDVVHAMPVAAALRRAHPGLHISWLVQEISAPLLECCSALDEVIVLPRYRWKSERTPSMQRWREVLAICRGLRGRRFDLSLDLHGYGKSAFYTAAARARYRLGWPRMRDGAWLVSRRVPHLPASRHRVEWFLDVVRALGVDPVPVTFPLVVPAQARERAQALLGETGVGTSEQFSVLTPATGGFSRRWPARSYARLAADLWAEHRLLSIVVGTAQEAALCEDVRVWAVEAGCGRGPVVLAGRTDLQELAALLERSAVHVCGDTSSAHIAAALGTPVIGLYGPTDPAFAGPWGQDHNVLARRDMCLPRCSERGCARAIAEGGDGRTACCMAAIEPSDVMARIGRVLASRPDGAPGAAARSAVGQRSAD